jgi:hypothetical protein
MSIPARRSRTYLQTALQLEGDAAAAREAARKSVESDARVRALVAAELPAPTEDDLEMYGYGRPPIHPVTIDRPQLPNMISEEEAAAAAEAAGSAGASKEKTKSETHEQPSPWLDETKSRQVSGKVTGMWGDVLLREPPSREYLSVEDISLADLSASQNNDHITADPITAAAAATVAQVIYTSPGRGGEGASGTENPIGIPLRRTPTATLKRRITFATDGDADGDAEFTAAAAAAAGATPQSKGKLQAARERKLAAAAAGVAASLSASVSVPTGLAGTPPRSPFSARPGGGGHGSPFSADPDEYEWFRVSSKEHGAGPKPPAPVKSTFARTDSGGGDGGAAVGEETLVSSQAPHLRRKPGAEARRREHTRKMVEGFRTVDVALHALQPDAQVDPPPSILNPRTYTL